MERLKRLWAFRGVAGRDEYWAILIVIGVVSRLTTTLGVSSGPTAAVFASILVLLIALLIHAAVAVRRLHDRGKSGWWALLFVGAGEVVGAASASMAALSWSPALVASALVVVGIALWGFIELAVLPGRQGPNRYLDPVAKEVAVFD
ncbi:DUF805 domain-containing protein [Phenylobacterium sp.]|uniref:DUF805 domain-containing protein n=1 Tax=Phenylobacterium sp. TaxID=1871053 RepID=UPI002DF0AEDE|nr:DUF805 domain-containing protein [Phenylobacterium sp.]